MKETWVQSLGQEDPLEKDMGTRSVFLPGNPMDRWTWWATIHEVAKELDKTWVTKQQQPIKRGDPYQ